MDVNDAVPSPPMGFPSSSSKQEMEFASISTGIFVFLVVLWSLFGAKLSARCQYLGEGSTACILGVLTGLVLLVATLPTGNNPVDAALQKDLLSFSSAAFFTYLLPPVIFNAGLSVEKSRFFRNLPSILSYGVAGTFVSFLVLVACLMALTSLTLQDTLAVGAIFSATDSVATLQTLEHHPNPLLFSLVFGEGVMNDATSVVLLRAVTRGCQGECPGLSWGVAGGILWSFLYLFVTSFLLGSATGLGISWAMKRAGLEGPHQEVSLIGLLAYLGYLLAELAGLSGILSLFCCGLVVSHYALHSCSAEGAATTVNTFRALSVMSEGLIFIYVGMDALDPVKWGESSPGSVLWLFAVLVVGLMLSRAAFVLPISLAHNRWAREQLSTRDIVVIWWAGLIRGAVSVALAYYQFDRAGGTPDAERSTLIVTTLSVVLVSILLLGALTKPLLALLLRESDESLMRRLAELRQQASSRIRRHQPLWMRHLGAYKAFGSASDLDSLRGGRDTPGAPLTPPLTPLRAQPLGGRGPWGEGGSEGGSVEARELAAKRRQLTPAAAAGASPGGRKERDLEGGDQAGWTDPPPGTPLPLSNIPVPDPDSDSPLSPFDPSCATPPRQPPCPPQHHLRTALEVEHLPPPGEATPLIQAGRRPSGEASAEPFLAHFWSTFDQRYMRPMFGGASTPPPFLSDDRVRDSVIERRGLD